MTDTDTNAALTFGDGAYSVDPTALPPAIAHRLMQSGFSHVLGNEVASQVVSAIRGKIAGPEGKLGDVTKDQIEAYRDANEQEVADLADTLRKAKIEKMLDGTLLVRVSAGPSIVRDPVAVAARSIAKAEVVALLSKAGAKFPTKGNTVTLGSNVFTADELIERRLGNPNEAERIQKAAAAKVAADKRAKAAVSKAVEQVNGEDLLAAI